MKFLDKLFKKKREIVYPIDEELIERDTIVKKFILPRM